MGWIRKIEVLERARPRDTAYNDTGEHKVNAPEHLGQVKIFERSARPDAPAGEGDVRPADLVTPADLKNALGIDVGAAGPYSGTPLAPAWFHVNSCRYTTGSGWTVDVHAAAGKRSRYLMVLGHMLTRAEGKPVQGVGRQAMLYPGVVSATTDEGTFAINVSTPDGPPPPDPLIALARAAVTRLGPS
jgi:hypothetical protein